MNIKTNLLALLFLCPLSALGGPLALEQVDITYRQFFQGGHEPLVTNNGLTNRELDKEIGFNLDLSLFKHGFWRNNVHGATDKGANGGGGQFRTIGWEFSLGVKLHQQLEISYYHHSQHVLDHAAPTHFPVKDAIQLKLILLQNNPQKGIF